MIRLDVAGGKILSFQSRKIRISRHERSQLLHQKQSLPRKEVRIAVVRNAGLERIGHTAKVRWRVEIDEASGADRRLAGREPAHVGDLLGDLSRRKMTSI